MAKFIFKLGGLLRQRENAQNQCMRDLAAVQGRLTALEVELRSVDDTVRAADRDLRENRLVGTVDLAFLGAHRRFSLAMQRKAVEIAQRMVQAQWEVDEAKQKLIEASRQKRIIEKLREQQLQRWREGQAQRETKELDEISMQLSIRESAEADATEASIERGVAGQR
jgi:flagellar FliJ protein